MDMQKACEVRATSFAFVSRFDARGSYLIFVFLRRALSCSRALVVGADAKIRMHGRAVSVTTIVRSLNALMTNVESDTTYDQRLIHL